MPLNVAKGFFKLMFDYWNSRSMSLFIPPHQTAWCDRSLASLQCCVSPYICFMCKLLLTALCQRQRETIWSVRSSEMTSTKTDVCPHQWNQVARRSRQNGENKKHGLFPPPRLFTFSWTAWNSDQQTFSKSHAAPIISVYCKSTQRFCGTFKVVNVLAVS